MKSSQKYHKITYNTIVLARRVIPFLNFNFVKCSCLLRFYFVPSFSERKGLNQYNRVIDNYFVNHLKLKKKLLKPEVFIVLLLNTIALGAVATGSMKA